MARVLYEVMQAHVEESWASESYLKRLLDLVVQHFGDEVRREVLYELLDCSLAHGVFEVALLRELVANYDLEGPAPYQLLKRYFLRNERLRVVASKVALLDPEAGRRLRQAGARYRFLQHQLD
jgi:hypothetical protein